VILDASGNPISASTDPGLRGGWVRTGPGIERPTSISQLLGQPVSRHLERTAARLAYLTNPLVFGAIEALHGITLGTNLTYGRMPDERADVAWREFWEVNHLHEMADRVFRERMTDGETLTLWPTSSTTLRRNRDQPARIGLYDVAMGWTYETIPGLPSEIESVLTDGNTIHGPGEFTYQGHLAGLWNDPRGFPVLMQAVPAALAYVNFLNSRIRLHRIQSRINAIYRAFIDPSWSADAQRKALQERAAAFEKIPSDGAVVTIGMNPENGEGETFEFPNLDKKSVDSSEDGRLLRMLFAVGLNLPLLLLSDGEDANKATGSVQLKSTVMALEKHQSIAWRWLQGVGRTELKRRYGPAQTYRVETRSTKGGRVVTESEQVTADLIELPVTLPEITADDAEGILAKVQYARSQGWVSSQTGAGMLGLDLLAELDLLSSEPAPESAGDDDDRGDEGDDDAVE
jgi:hypothetical protein